MKLIIKKEINMERIKSASLMTAIKTPYRPDGEVDLETFDSLVEAQIKNGVEGLIVCGTTGEGHLMDWEEHLMLIAHCVNQFGDQLAIVGNTGSNNTREALKGTIMEKLLKQALKSISQGFWIWDRQSSIMFLPALDRTCSRN